MMLNFGDIIDKAEDLQDKINEIEDAIMLLIDTSPHRFYYTIESLRTEHKDLIYQLQSLRDKMV